jgi:integrase
MIAAGKCNREISGRWGREFHELSRMKWTRTGRLVQFAPGYFAVEAAAKLLNFHWSKVKVQKVRTDPFTKSENRPVHCELERRRCGLAERHGEFYEKKDRRARHRPLGSGSIEPVQDLPAEGVLFPYLSRVRANDRATEFRSRCRQLGINGVTLHSYRYAWAERAKTVGYPERFAQEALGHNSKAVHRAYAKRALMKIPSLEDYEQRAS